VIRACGRAESTLGSHGWLGKAGPAMGKASGKMIYKWWLEKTSLAMENGCVRDLSLEHLVE